jgi:hypothetical protein
LGNYNILTARSQHRHDNKKPKSLCGKSVSRLAKRFAIC